MSSPDIFDAIQQKDFHKVKGLLIADNNLLKTCDNKKKTVLEHLADLSAWLLINEVANEAELGDLDKDALHAYETVLCAALEANTPQSTESARYLLDKILCAYNTLELKPCFSFGLLAHAIKAAVSGDNHEFISVMLKKIPYLLSQPVNFKAQTLIELLAIQKHWDTIKKIIEQHKEAEPSRIQTSSAIKYGAALYYAVEANTAEATRVAIILIQQKAELDDNNNRRHKSISHVAASKGNQSVLFTMLQNNPELLTRRDTENFTIIEILAKAKYWHIIESLIKEFPQAVSNQQINYNVILFSAVKANTVESMRVAHNLIQMSVKIEWELIGWNNQIDALSFILAWVNTELDLISLDNVDNSEALAVLRRNNYMHLIPTESLSAQEDSDEKQLSYLNLQIFHILNKISLLEISAGESITCEMGFDLIMRIVTFIHENFKKINKPIDQDTQIGLNLILTVIEKNPLLLNFKNNQNNTVVEVLAQYGFWEIIKEIIAKHLDKNNGML